MAQTKELRVIGVTRKIGGKVYTLAGHVAYTKAEAKKRAKIARSKGKLVRIVKMSDGYYIYYRK